MAAFQDHSGSITAGDASQEVMGRRQYRRLFFFQNISDTEMWLGFGATATKDQPSIRVAAGATLTFEQPAIPHEAVNVICATTGKKFVAKQI